MKYIQKIFENAPVINNPMVKFTSKSDKLETIKNEINALLSTKGDKQIGFNYATGSKGIFFTNSEGNLVDEAGYAVTTYSELCSNLEAILYLLKQLDSTNSVPLPAPPTGETLPDGPIGMPATPLQGPEIIQDEPIGQVVGQIQVAKFESFKS